VIYESNLPASFEPTLVETVWESPQMDYFCAEVGEQLILSRCGDGLVYVRTDGEDGRILGELSRQTAHALRLNRVYDCDVEVRVQDRGIHDACIWYQVAISADDGTDLKKLVDGDPARIHAIVTAAIEQRNAEGRLF